MSSPTTFEFAKRWFYKGEEVSPFPVGGLHESLSSFSGLQETFRLATDKGWFRNSNGAGPVQLKHLLLALGFHPAFAKRILKGYRRCT
jgi:hypothetical protein